MAMAHQSEPDWAGLPEHLLDLICVKLDLLRDCFSFGAVCLSWQSIAMHNRKELHNKTSIPLLMIPTKDSSKNRRSLYSVTDGKVYDLQLSVPFNRRCCGSSYGWLVVFDKTLALTLFNPFLNNDTTNYKTPISLPPLKSSNGYHGKFAIVKVVLSANPALENDFVVAAIYDVYQRLAVKRAGDKSWTYIDENLIQFRDVIFYRGQILAVDQRQKIVSVDLFNNNQAKIISPGRPMSYGGHTYLVESFAGDILLVQREFYGDILMVQREFYGEGDDGELTDKYNDLTERFDVYKLVLGGEQTETGMVVEKIEEMKSLGEETLFLGDNHSMSVMASKYPGLKSNSIYYTDDHPEYNNYGYRDTGIFSLKDKSLDKHYLPNPSQKKLPPPIWIVPTPVIRM